MPAPIGHINVASEFVVRGAPVIDWPPKQWKDVPRLVRVVFDDPGKLAPVLRALMHHERQVEVLDVDAVAYGWLVYDPAVVRRCQERHGLPQMAPWVKWTTRSWALERIAEVAS